MPFMAMAACSQHGFPRLSQLCKAGPLFAVGVGLSDPGNHFVGGPVATASESLEVLSLFAGILFWSSFVEPWPYLPNVMKGRSGCKVERRTEYIQ